MLASAVIWSLKFVPTGSGKEEEHKANEIVKILNKIQYIVDDCLSCASFHANKKHSLALEKATIAPIPLFLDSGPSVTMIKCIMITSKKAIQYLSSDQVPFVAMDQPLYALA